MKKLFLLAFSAAAFAACSEKEYVDPNLKFDIISFEESEQMLDQMGGGEVVLGDLEMSLMDSNNEYYSENYKNVFCAKGYVEAPVNFDGPLFSDAEQNVIFGSYYAGTFDMWGGFTLSRNYNKTATTVDYKDQFSAWTTKGARGTKTCMIGYDSDFTGGGSYALPTIEFVEPRAVDHLYMANSTLTHAYTPSHYVPEGEAYFYKVVITGWLDGVETGKVECVLINGKVKAEDWKKVSLRSLGAVDKLVFKPASNDLLGTYMNDPAYFCIDEIALVKQAAK